MSGRFLQVERLQAESACLLDLHPQLCGEPPDSKTRNSLPAPERNCRQQPGRPATEGREPVLHGQDVHQVGQGLQEALELREGSEQDDRRPRQGSDIHLDQGSLSGGLP